VVIDMKVGGRQVTQQKADRDRGHRLPARPLRRGRRAWRFRFHSVVTKEPREALRR
jgi:hypothetical protein